MYPPVTQFETRDMMVADELRLREQRQRFKSQSSPRASRAMVLPIRLARMLTLAASHHRPGPEPPYRHTGQSGDPENIWPLGWKAM
jgi:hypothetical protein